MTNFRTIWCAPCRKETPDPVKTSHRLQDKSIQFPGLSIDETDKGHNFQKPHPTPYPLPIAPVQTLDLTAPPDNIIQRLPFTLRLDQKNALLHIRPDLLNTMELEGKIRALLPSESMPKHIQHWTTCRQLRQNCHHDALKTQ